MTSNRSSTSLSLLERVRGKDADAWQHLVYLYGQLVSYWCNQWGVRGADADDVRQDVFQAVATGLGNFHRDRAGDTFRGWLRGITRNKVLDHFRRRQQQPNASGGSAAQLRLQEVPQPELPESEDAPEEVSSLYHRALELVRSEFEEKTWQAFWRAAVEGQSPADIAADLGVSPAAVRQSKSRVLRRLKEEVGDLIE